MTIEERYAQELRRLKQRIYYRKQQGYNIDINKLLQDRGNFLEDDIEYMRSLRGVNLLSYADYGSDEVSTYDTSTNEEDFVPPSDYDDPNIYSNIFQIEQLLLEFPNTKVMVFDVGQLGELHKMDEADIEFIGDALYDIWNNMVAEAGEYGTLLELDDYYGKIEDELAEFLEPLHSESMYYLESELLTGMTRMMQLLNGGNALSMAEMQLYSPMFTDMDLVNNEWKN
ncbi:MAG: hypothetical protein J6L69_02965 [Lachnospiraceae bacterium]|nr:hypothetical protein [Lachnospiraceae bacterium]